MNLITSQRRFTEMAKGHPADVVPLPSDHAAMVEMRTLFPSTVRGVEAGVAILISGHNNRKIGRCVTKGPWAGMPIFMLTLEERATCPSTCYMLTSCYGNAMHMARRNRHGEAFEIALKAEVKRRANEHPNGFVVRLHVLGDFYSLKYVELWRDALRSHSNLCIYGYTARALEDDDGIGLAIGDLNSDFEGRSYIRWSEPTSGAFGATVIDRAPKTAVVPEGVVCPAETSSTECCATCGLCWSPAMESKTIVFIKHGKGASTTKGELRQHVKSTDGLRRVKPLAFSTKTMQSKKGEIIEIRQVAPTDLVVDERYQRNLSGKSIALIKNLTLNWDWRKFNLPTVVQDADGTLHLIDGQHTALAAATRADIAKLPVKIVGADKLQERAATFVGINRDRISVTQNQIFYAEIQAGETKAVAVKAMCDEADVIVLRQPPSRNEFGAGETMAIRTLYRLYEKCGPTLGLRILKICREAKLAPISDWAIIALLLLMTSKKYEPRLSDAKIITAMTENPKVLMAAAYLRHAETKERLPAAVAEILWERLK